MSLTISPRRPPPDEVERPPVLPFAAWYRAEEATFTQGQHVLICGPTQSGKTTLARFVVEIRSYVAVLGTKPNEDPALLAYEEAGYLRIDHWPPTRADIRKMPTEDLRFLVWPQINAYSELRGHRDLYRRVLEDVFIDGRWCVVIDEGLWMASREGLDLGDQMSALAYGAASNKVSMVLLSQRPANIPPVTWTSVSQALLFHMGRVEDVRDLASLGTYEAPAAVEAVRRLRAHQFLDMPVRAQADWSISEIPADWLNY